MKLAIHGGTHKTATTSFQTVLTTCREMLTSAGIMVPRIEDWNQHSYLAWLLQKPDPGEAARVLETCVAQARDAQCHTILLSGEDFENHLVETAEARRFSMMARDLGIESLEWFFVARKPVDYMHALYSTLSGQRVLINLDELAATILAKGYFSISNSSYAYHFVFDVRRFALRLSEAHVGTVAVIPFADFVADYPGRVLLERLGVTGAAQAPIAALARDVPPLNTRLSVHDIEWGYALTALGIDRSDRRAIETEHDLIGAVTRSRMIRAASIIPQVDLALSRAGFST